MFGSGTAVSIQPIEAIGYNDKIYEVKYDPKLNAGELSHKLFDMITEIQVFYYYDYFIRLEANHINGLMLCEIIL